MRQHLQIQRLYKVVMWRKKEMYIFMMSTKRKEEDGRKKRLMPAETPFVTNGLFNLKYLIGFKAL